MFQKEAEWVEGPAVEGNQVKYESLERKSVGLELRGSWWEKRSTRQAGAQPRGPFA